MKRQGFLLVALAAMGIGCSEPRLSDLSLADNNKQEVLKGRNATAELIASKGHPPYTWSVSGEEGNILLDQSTGPKVTISVSSDAVLAAGEKYIIRVKDSSGVSVSYTYTLEDIDPLDYRLFVYARMRDEEHQENLNDFDFFTNTSSINNFVPSQVISLGAILTPGGLKKILPMFLKWTENTPLESFKGQGVFQTDPSTGTADITLTEGLNPSIASGVYTAVYNDGVINLSTQITLADVSPLPPFTISAAADVLKGKQKQIDLDALFGMGPDYLWSVTAENGGSDDDLLIIPGNSSSSVSLQVNKNNSLTPGNYTITVNDSAQPPAEAVMTVALEDLNLEDYSLIVTAVNDQDPSRISFDPVSRNVVINTFNSGDTITLTAVDWNGLKAFDKSKVVWEVLEDLALSGGTGTASAIAGEAQIQISLSPGTPPVQKAGSYAARYDDGTSFTGEDILNAVITITE